MTEQNHQRLGGITRLYGAAARDRLQKAHVCVVGLGGVGSWVVEALARSGVGHLTLIDPDDVCISNTNRQIQALTENIGKSKIEALALRIKQINPACTTTLIQKFFTQENAAELLSPSFDYVVDAIDGVTAKAWLIGTCSKKGLRIVTCGGSGGKTDPSKIQVADLARTGHDRLLFYVRKKLRRHFGFPMPDKKFKIPCVYSPEPVRLPEGCTVQPTHTPLEGEVRLNCEGALGAATFVSGVFGFHMAALVVNELTALQTS